ncbi:MAG: hypothetical protein RSF40_01630 [Oscillospiraceae bacterium]
MNTSYIDKLLNFDPIAAVEEMTEGKHWSEFDDSESNMSLWMAVMSGEAKRNALKEIGDTYWGMTWSEFISLIEKHGFKCALRYDIPYENKLEEAIIYYNNYGFVIWATSFSEKKSVNGGTLYGQLRTHQDFSHCDDLSQCSNGYFADDKLSFSVDVREGLFHHLNKAIAHADPLSIWEDNAFLWFVDYVEDDEPTYDYKAITQDKIHRCPSEFQNIVRVCTK